MGILRGMGRSRQMVRIMVEKNESKSTPYIRERAFYYLYTSIIYKILYDLDLRSYKEDLI